MTPDSLTRQFPAEVHQSLAELRAIAKAAKSRHDPQLRRATADEIALAETQRQPNHCTGYSTRTGLPCSQKRALGGQTCLRHGANLPTVRAARERRLQRMADLA